jgi:antitoxin component YwqK of YwqJK toxin-antitoxin module
MNILNNNILQYILNQYLDWEEDISKLHQIFNFKFHIKIHIIYDKVLHFTKKMGYRIYLDNKIIKFKLYFLNGNPDIEENYKNGKLHGIQKEWYKNGKLMKEQSYICETQKGIQKYYKTNGTLSYMIDLNIE